MTSLNLTHFNIIKMKRSYKYRIYPNILQQQELSDIFDFCRYLYNGALEERISYYKKFKKSLSYCDQAGSLIEVKQLFPDKIGKIYSQTLQATLKQLDISYKNFFKRIKTRAKAPGFPRFKNQYRFRSILFPQVSIGLSKSPVKIKGNKLKLYGISGEIPIILHRPIGGIAKQCRIVKESSGKFYIIVSRDNVPNEYQRELTGKTIGIDFGISNFITLDDGTTFHHPKPYKTAKEKLAYRQRKLAKKKKGSNKRKKQKVLVAKTNENIVNIRKDFQHKLANKLIKENDVIVIEKLNIEKMMESKGFSVRKSNISDASWGSFVTILKYKAESANVLIKEVNPVNTSKTCSHCGNIKESLSLSDREYICDKCGLIIDRDKNAAINIKNLIVLAPGTGAQELVFREAPAFMQG